MRVALLTRIAILSLVCYSVSSRSLKQASSPPPVTASQLTEAIKEINAFAKVPDTSKAVAQTPGYSSAVANLQGPASEIVQAAALLNAPIAAPTASTYNDYVAALRAFGYQSGKNALGPSGQALYSAYQSLTAYLGFRQQ